MENSIDERAAISSICDRLERVLGTGEFVIVGGIAIKLSVDNSRPLHDIDVAVPPKYLHGVKENTLTANGFEGIFDGDKLVIINDKVSGLEVELSARACGKLNATLGLPPYTEENPTILGLPLSEVLEKSVIIDVDGAKVRIPNPLHQIIMKYNLWLYRSNGKIKDQKDAADIAKLVRFYYKDIDTFISNEIEGIKTYCRARPSDVFVTDIKKILYEG